MHSLDATVGTWIHSYGGILHWLRMKIICPHLSCICWNQMIYQLHGGYAELFEALRNMDARGETPPCWVNSRSKFIVIGKFQSCFVCYSCLFVLDLQLLSWCFSIINTTGFSFRRSEDFQYFHEVMRVKRRSYSTVFMFNFLFTEDLELCDFQWLRCSAHALRICFNYSFGLSCPCCFHFDFEASLRGHVSSMFCYELSYGLSYPNLRLNTDFAVIVYTFWLAELHLRLVFRRYSARWHPRNCHVVHRY